MKRKNPAPDAGRLPFFARVNAAIERRPCVTVVLWSLLLCLVMEALSRRSPWQAIVFLFTSPHIFLYNMLILGATLSLCLFLRRRYWALFLITGLWFGVAVADCIVLAYRVTPIGAIDIALLGSVLGMINIYLSIPQIVLIVVAILAAVAGVIVAIFKMPKHRVPYKRVGIFAASACALVWLTTIGAHATSVLPERFTNLSVDYTHYGFTYCFSRSVVDRGVDKPGDDDYIRTTVAEILSNLGEDAVPEDKPNVVFLQLESFFDVNYLKNITFSENPIPVFTSLKENYPDALLTVPALGSGTANTEFEVLTGMSLAHFGAAEYPYRTLLLSNTCESMATDFKSAGYASHAIHNHTGTFYDRNEVYASLGFDSFTPLEYMKDVEENPLGWAKDKILTREILDTLTTSEGRDFIYTVSVQGHGKYPREEIDPTQTISLSGIEDEDDAIAFTYYVNQLHEMDAFLGELTEALSSFGEPVALVLYGDHLPAFHIYDDDLTAGNIFTTEYVFWSNMPVSAEDGHDLCAYELSAYVMDTLGVRTGVLSKFHTAYAEDEKYDDYLKLLEYDAFYGKRYLYGGHAPEASDMQMGIHPIRITNVARRGDKVYVYGENFTPQSRVMVNGRKCTTDFLDEHTLVLAHRAVKTDDKITVGQVAVDEIVLSRTPAWTYAGD